MPFLPSDRGQDSNPMRLRTLRPPKLALPLHHGGPHSVLCIHNGSVQYTHTIDSWTTLLHQEV
ncbi:hypothetical protein E2C01_030216 [Portunus trituberculatus]|uniref:Uncharacterized protein n=1 Tax=Portunus trituberculatus TaxID=210409 RepID=A0A5B7EU39_PORTR|nr:hypothetical protein [Portunus trituberculatus]